MNANIKNWFEQHEQEVKKLSDDIWHHPESAMNEFVSCKLVCDFLSERGFEVDAFDVNGKGGRPNAIVARAGHGKPVIGFLGEYDALNGLGQQAVPYQAPIEGPGHGCGHNMMGAACAGAAVSLKTALEKEGLEGTVVYFGCPAEETIQGKALMIKAGCFDGVDVCLAWHPANEALFVSERVLLANTNMLFDFHGKTAHAAASPEKGRSALDAAELMNVGVQFLREHVPDEVRMHYVYSHGGERPNVVPDYAQLHYFIRAGSRELCDEVVERVKKIAKGAAMMTETEVEWRELSSCAATKILHTLNKHFRRAAVDVGEIEFSDEDRAYAAEIYRNVYGKDCEQDVLPTNIQPLTGKTPLYFQSSDFNDVSQILPASQMMGMGMVRSCPEHHWSVVALGGSPVGQKVCVHTAKIMAQCGYDLITGPEALAEIKQEFAGSKPKEA